MTTSKTEIDVLLKRLKVFYRSIKTKKTLRSSIQILKLLQNNTKWGNVHNRLAVFSSFRTLFDVFVIRLTCSFDRGRRKEWLKDRSKLKNNISFCRFTENCLLCLQTLLWTFTLVKIDKITEFSTKSRTKSDEIYAIFIRIFWVNQRLSITCFLYFLLRRQIYGDNDFNLRLWTCKKKHKIGSIIRSSYIEKLYFGV